ESLAPSREPVLSSFASSRTPRLTNLGCVIRRAACRLYSKCVIPNARVLSSERRDLACTTAERSCVTNSSYARYGAATLHAGSHSTPSLRSVAQGRLLG